jgi:hypothetical protein
MKSESGLILRRTGLLIEMVCLLLFVALRHSEREVAGLDLRHVLIAGLAVGFVIWVVGMALFLVQTPTHRTRG